MGESASKPEDPPSDFPDKSVTQEPNGDPLGVQSVSRAETASKPAPPVRLAIEEAKGKPNAVRNLEFKTYGPRSEVIVKFDHKPQYREVKYNQVHQLVYYFSNTVTSPKLERAYDTTEFQTPIALFSLLQMPQSTPPLTKLIVQLREDANPAISVSQDTLYVDFDAPSGTGEARLRLGSHPESEAVEENIYNGGKVFQGKVIDRLEIKDSDIQDALRMIVRSSGYNIVVGEDVKGRVGTLSLSNVPWDQAFTLVLQSKALGYVRQGNVIRVETLAHLKQEKEAALANEKSLVNIQPLRTLLIPISYAKADDMLPRVKPFLTDRGSVQADTRTNTLIIKDVDSVVTRGQKLVAALDTQPPRVGIAAKFVEVLTSFSRKLGLQCLQAGPFSGQCMGSYGGLGGYGMGGYGMGGYGMGGYGVGGMGGLGGYGAGGMGGLGGYGGYGGYGSSGGFGYGGYGNSIYSNYGALGYGGGFYGLNYPMAQFNMPGQIAMSVPAAQVGSLMASLQLAEADSNLKTLAAPTVSVVANSQATIEQGFAVYVVTPSFGGGAMYGMMNQVQAKLTLQVTPTVSGDGSIFLDLDITNQIPRTDLQSSGGASGSSSMMGGGMMGGQGGFMPMDTRHVKTKILLENGDTAILGSVFHNTSVTGRQGIPLLMKIPILGYLFSSDVNEEDGNEVYIFLTAKIENPEEAFKSAP